MKHLITGETWSKSLLSETETCVVFALHFKITGESWNIRLFFKSHVAFIWWKFDKTDKIWHETSAAGMVIKFT